MALTGGPGREGPCKEKKKKLQMIQIPEIPQNSCPKEGDSQPTTKDGSRRLGSVHGSFLFATHHFFLFSATVPSFLFHLHWCGLLCGPQFPGRWHGVPVSKRVSPALCTIMFTSRCFLSRLLWCIPPHPPVSPAHSGCCPFLTRFERLRCWCMVA